MACAILVKAGTRGARFWRHRGSAYYRLLTLNIAKNACTKGSQLFTRRLFTAVSPKKKAFEAA